MSYNKCAPGKGDKYSCFSLNALQRIARKYNNLHNDKIDLNMNRIQLIDTLKEKFAPRCDDNQVCWLKTTTVKQLNDDEEIQYETFRPEGPNQKYGWLSTDHINEVLTQYENVYKDFKYLGTVSYDFEEIPGYKIATLDFDDLYNKGYNRYGMVINLSELYDKSGGTHWVSLYFDLLKNQIYFFDSVGNEPGRRIRKFITKIINFMYGTKFKTDKKYHFKSKLNIVKNLDYKGVDKILKGDKELNNLLGGFDIKYNNVQHQFENSECGVYSINFIVRLLQGESFNHIINNVTTDEKMNQFRKEYFRNT